MPRSKPQLCPQLVYVVSYGWWRGAPTWTYHHPSTNHNSLHRRVVGKVVVLGVTPEFFKYLYLYIYIYIYISSKLKIITTGQPQLDTLRTICLQEDILDSSQLKVLRFKSAKESLVGFINVCLYIYIYIYMVAFLVNY